MRAPEARGRTRTWHSWATVHASSALGILLAGIAGLTVIGLTLIACEGGLVPATPGASVAGVSSGPTSSHGASTATPSTPAPSRTAPAASAPKRQESVAVGDDERVVDLFVPPTPAGTRAPLLVLLHASGESPFLMASESHAGELAAREGVIVALPPALGRRWDGMVSAGDPITPSADATYILGLVDRLAAELPVDRGRVFVAGFSIGAVMSERIACQFADRVTAVALNAGAPWSDTCSPPRPLPILVMHGTEDSTFRIALASQVVERWRAADRCSGDAVVTKLSDIATSELNDHCADDVEVQYVRYEGAGHRWFADPDATDVMWSFFSAAAPR